MRLTIDPDRCQGHTLCKLAAPELVHLRADDGHAYAVTENVPKEQEHLARRAALGCPEGAIVLFE